MIQGPHKELKHIEGKLFLIEHDTREYTEEKLFLIERDTRELDLKNNDILDDGLLDLTGLKGLSKLSKLNLSFNRKLVDIRPLAGLLELRELELWSNKICDLRPLNRLTNLEDLTITFSQVSDITPLRTLTNLKYLNLHSNKISSVDPLMFLVNLVGLNLSSNPIVNIDSLYLLSNLKKFFLGRDESWQRPNISLESLRHLQNLEMVWVKNYKIDSFRPLLGLEKLKRLSLMSCDVIDPWQFYKIDFVNLIGNSEECGKMSLHRHKHFWWSEIKKEFAEFCLSIAALDLPVLLVLMVFNDLNLVPDYSRHLQKRWTATKIVKDAYNSKHNSYVY